MSNEEERKTEVRKKDRSKNKVYIFTDNLSTLRKIGRTLRVALKMDRKGFSFVNALHSLAITIVEPVLYLMYRTAFCICPITA